MRLELSRFIEGDLDDIASYITQDPRPVAVELELGAISNARFSRVRASSRRSSRQAVSNPAA